MQQMSYLTPNAFDRASKERFTLKAGAPVEGSHYLYVKTLGEGSYGSVYEVEHSYLKQRMVMKVLHASHLEKAHVLEGFEFEAKLLANQIHPNIVRVIDGGFTQGEEKRPFFIMEKHKGETLFALLKKRKEGLPILMALSIAIDLLGALDTAHCKYRVIHRDIKPSNILVCRTSPFETKAMLLDFGIAVLKERYFKTSQGFSGTVKYAAPEQFRGCHSEASDVYAFGLVLFLMLTGKHVFEGCLTVEDWTSAHLTKSIPDLKLSQALPHEFISELSSLVKMCLEKDEEKRIKSANALKVKLIHIKEKLEVFLLAPREYTQKQSIESMLPFYHTDELVSPFVSTLEKKEDLKSVVPSDVKVYAARNDEAAPSRRVLALEEAPFYAKKNQQGSSAGVQKKKSFSLRYLSPKKVSFGLAHVDGEPSLKNVVFAFFIGSLGVFYLAFKVTDFFL